MFTKRQNVVFKNKQIMNKNSGIQHTFLTTASEILAATDSGLSWGKIVKFFRSKSFDNNVDIPYSTDLFPTGEVPNKRTAFLKNLECFPANLQYEIILELSNLDFFKENKEVTNLKYQLVSRYFHLSDIKINNLNSELVLETQHWLSAYPKSLNLFNSAFDKFKAKIYLRNLLDDLRLSLEVLLKELLNNDKSLENQIGAIGLYQQQKGNSKETANMFQKLLDYYSKYQNDKVKHDDKVNEQEIELIFELTSTFMKYLIKH